MLSRKAFFLWHYSCGLINYLFVHNIMEEKEAEMMKRVVSVSLGSSSRDHKVMTAIKG
jgi:hypothetical protein